MQHTEKYQLNLIEKDDVFSPDPLNENVQKVEGALEGAIAHADAGDAAEAAARTEADAALDQRLQAIEAHKLVIGSADDSSTFHYLGFKPTLIYVVNSSGGGQLVINGRSNYSGFGLKDNGFYHNGAYASCRYVAFI